jgi:hypothetical protein
VNLIIGRNLHTGSENDAPQTPMDVDALRGKH